MDVSLRKAATLEKKIREVLSGLSVRSHQHVTLSVHGIDNVEKKLAETRSDFMGELLRIDRLEEAQYAIRSAVTRKQAEVGINVLLTEEAHLKSRIQRLTQIAAIDPRKEIEDLRTTLASMAERTKTSPLARGDEVASPVLDKDDVVAFKKQLVEVRRQLNKTGDRIADLNASTRIPLSAEVVQTLTDEGLV